LLGVNEFIEDKELYDSGRHLLEDDKLVYGCYLRIYKKEPESKKFYINILNNIIYYIYSIEFNILHNILNIW